MDTQKTARPRGTDSAFVEDFVKEIWRAYQDAQNRYGEPIYLSHAQAKFVAPYYKSENNDFVSTGCVSLDGRCFTGRTDGVGRIVVKASDVPSALCLAGDNDF